MAGGFLLFGALTGCSAAAYEKSLDAVAVPARGPAGRNVMAASDAGTTNRALPAADIGATDRVAARKFEVPPDPELPYKHEEVSIDAAHPYTLPELIDLAQRNNPTTRIAWEQAKQAALALGLVEATSLPDLSAQVLGGAQRITFPVPRTLVPEGKLTAETNELIPALVLKWLLFDFGQRANKAESARQRASAAKVGFLGAHQKCIFEVSKAYFALDAVRAQLRVAESALHTAHVLQEAAEEKFNHGVATIVEVDTAKRGTAKARYTLALAREGDNDAYHGLLEAMGLTPTLKMHIAPSLDRKLPTGLSQDVAVSIRHALVRRPDIVAALDKLRASQAGVKAARAAFFPTVGVESFAGINHGGISVDRGPYAYASDTTTGFLFKLNLPLFDGGMRLKHLAMAHSEEAAAREELAQRQDEAIRQVARAHDRLTSTLAQYEAACAFEAAANTELESAIAAYRFGVSTFTVAETAETNHTQAQASTAQAHAAVLTAAAALAFATGDLTSSDVLEQPRSLTTTAQGSN